MKIVKRKNINELHKTPIELDETVYLEKENIYLHLVKNDGLSTCGDICYLEDNCPHTWDGVGCRYFYHFESLNEIEVLILNDKE